MGTIGATSMGTFAATSMGTFAATSMGKFGATSMGKIYGSSSCAAVACLTGAISSSRMISGGSFIFA